MTTTIAERLAGIGDFLRREVLPGVKDETKGELRAAIKLLDDMVPEADLLPGLLETQAAERLDLCAKVVRVLDVDPSPVSLLRARWEQRGKTMAELTAIHAEAGMLLAGLVNRLDQAEKALRHEAYALLADHAAPGTTWQSVFPGGPLYADDCETGEEP